MKRFIKLVLTMGLFFASTQGFSNQDDIEKIYQSLKPQYESMSKLKEVAKKGKTINYISAALALVIFLLFAKFFKLYGVIVALMMIAAGYYVINRANSAPKTYETLFKQKIISPLSGGYRYTPDAITLQDIKNSKIFLPTIKNYTIVDTYRKRNISLAYVVAIFYTKENASVERFNENKFNGIFIKLEKPTKSNGVVISDAFREKVADMDIEFSTFFADAKRVGKREGFDIYGEIRDEEFDKIVKLSDKSVAISFTNDAIYILLYRIEDPLKVDIFREFNRQVTQEYAEFFKMVDEVVELFE